MQATNSPIAGTVFMACLFAVSCVALNAVHQTASRMTWSFARDDALFGSRWLGRVHEGLNVPIYALVANGVIVMLIGIVYACSTTGIQPRLLILTLTIYMLTRKAFNAFISTTVIIAQVSFAIPALLLLIRRRDTHYLPAKRVFKVPDVIGYIANTVCVLWAVVETVFFCFPASFPVTGGNMSMSFLLLLCFD